MSKVESLKAFVSARLTAAAVEILGAVEATIAEYEEEISREKEQNRRLQSVLDTLQPVLKLTRAGKEQGSTYQTYMLRGKIS